MSASPNHPRPAHYLTFEEFTRLPACAKKTAHKRDANELRREHLDDFATSIEEAHSFADAGLEHMANYRACAPFDAHDAGLEYLHAREALRIARAHVDAAARELAAEMARAAVLRPLRTRTVRKGRQ